MALAYRFSSHNTNSFFIKLRIKRIIRNNYTNYRAIFDDFMASNNHQIMLVFKK